ncbi:MAG: Holliday junction resolvase RuvX [Acidobacteriota bacterium]
MSRVLGLDYGEKRIGLALSDETRTLASGRGIMQRTSLPRDLDALRRFIEENDVGAVVLGFPFNMDGTPSRMAEQVQAFGESLRQLCSIEVLYWDERLTTVVAQAALREQNIRASRKRQLVDEMSAILILQSFLDSRKS